jgi:hypothetical protein
MILNFYRNNNRWFIDLPEYLEAGGDVDDLEMIFGADTFLSDRCIIGSDVVRMNVETEKVSGYSELVKSSNDLEHGAFYVHVEQVPYSYDCNTEPDYTPTIREVVWLCDVVKFIFGKFPQTIYFRVL